MIGRSFIGRGRASGGFLMLLGVWGALAPFVGPYFGVAYTPDRAWAYTSGRLWLSVLPGAAVFIGGLVVVASARAASAGAFLAALGGSWLVLGTAVLALAKPDISPGTPVTARGALFSPATMHFLEGLGFFFGLGVLILFLAARALGRAGVARVAAAELEQAAPFDEYTPY